MEIEVRMSPEKQKITEAAKGIIRYMCRAKPWKRHKGENSFDIVLTFGSDKDAGDAFEKLRCLLDITYERKVKIGTFAVDWAGGSPFSGIVQDDNKIRVHCVEGLCDGLFTENLPSVLDAFNAWDDIVCREPIQKKKRRRT